MLNRLHRSRSAYWKRHHNRAGLAGCRRIMRLKWRVDIDDIDEPVIDKFLDAETGQFAAVTDATYAAERQIGLDPGEPRKMLD